MEGWEPMITVAARHALTRVSLGKCLLLFFLSQVSQLTKLTECVSLAGCHDGTRVFVVENSDDRVSVGKYPIYTSDQKR